MESKTVDLLCSHDSDAAGGKLGHQNSWEEKTQPGTHSPMGMSMMLKAGWKPGQALGRNPDTGLKTPIQTMLRLDRTCIGHEDALNVKSDDISTQSPFSLYRSGEKRNKKRGGYQQRHSFPPEVMVHDAS